MLATAACSRDLCKDSLCEVMAISLLFEALGPCGMAMKARMEAVFVVAAKCLSYADEVVIVSRLSASLAPRSAWARRVVLIASQ